MKAWFASLWQKAPGRRLITGELKDRLETAQVEREEHTTALRRKYSSRLFWLMVAQIIFANWLIWQIARTHQWIVSDAILTALIGSVTVQIIGLVLAITRSIFPAEKAAPESSPPSDNKGP